MLLHNIENPLIVILGPTAVGKTDLSIKLARSLDGEIISADSRLFYRGMDIGTAKPDNDEMDGIPHHLINVSNPDEIWSLALFQKNAVEIIEDCHQRKKIPFLVGGTGQYIKAVVEGWQIPAQEPNEALRKKLEDIGSKIGNESLYEKLLVLDPKAGEFVDQKNLRRIVRALEVIFLTGKRFSETRLKKGCPYSVKQIGLIRPRKELYERIDLRIENMINDGLLEETQKLIDEGYTENLSPMSAIGYREMISMIKGEMTLDEAVVQMKRLTRNFVRRQANWFKPENPMINWFNVGEQSYDEILDFIQSEKGWIDGTEFIS